MLRLITDFDGPIIDVSERYYNVYKFCLDSIRYPDQPVQQLGKAEFWQLKRSRVPEKKLRFFLTTQAQIAQLRQTVHTPPYFKYDCLAPGA